MTYKQNDPLMILAESRIDDYQQDHDKLVLVKESKAISYHIPKDIAHELCAEVREDVQGQWLTAQFWRCQGCMLFKKNAEPRGLAMSNKNQCCCAAIAKRYGHDLS